MSKNWRHIIDPGFDETVKTLISVAQIIKDLPNDGLLELPEELLGLIKSYIENPQDTKEMIQLFKELKLLNPLILDILLTDETTLRNDFSNFKNLLIEVATQLPNPSRDYYIYKIETTTANIDSEALNKAYNDEEELFKIQSSLKNFSTTMCSLVFRSVFIDLERLINGELENINDEIIKNPDFIKFFISSIYNLIAQLAFKNTTSELLQKGDDKSLVRAVRINKMLLYTEQVSNRLIQAQFTGDIKFLTQLGNAISAPPLQSIDPNNETFIVLITFWTMGLQDMKPRILYDFLKNDCNLFLSEEPETFRRFLYRHIKPLFKC